METIGLQKMDIVFGLARNELSSFREFPWGDKKFFAKRAKKLPLQVPKNLCTPMQQSTMRQCFH